jgi:hypothetical protein
MKTAHVYWLEVCMIGRAVKIVLLVILVVGIGAFVLGWWTGGGEFVPDAPVGAAGRVEVDTSKAREVGAKVGEATARAANQAQETIATGSVTAKIKSKMALDDLVKARNINVDTNGTVVTLTGVVGSEAERQRALSLARETEGITSVVDRLRVQ